MRRFLFPVWLVALVSAAGCSSATVVGVPLSNARSAAHGVAPALSFQVLHVFEDGNDGAEPYAALLLNNGALYGTTYAGGDSNDAGTVYRITQGNAYSIIHRFVRQAPPGHRANPDGGLVSDPAGNLYGTTTEGGPMHMGTVYKINPAGQVITLHTFTGSDGDFPYATLLRDTAGNLYGTTKYGGASACTCGTVFKIDSTGRESVLYSFAGGTDGSGPYGGVVRDAQGTLYGTTLTGGSSHCVGEGCGIVFKIDSHGHETVLHRFPNSANDGGHPGDTLLFGPDGNLYGTTDSGGTVDRGTVFKIDKAGHETVLYNFTGGSDGAGPFAGLIQGAAGKFLGTTEFGGGTQCQLGCGTVFELDSLGHETVLYAFTGGADGAYPIAGVIADAAGVLYGTTSQNGDAECRNGVGCGALFKLKP
ncbi:MAG TPA: choice-of-anchor tandem repeat GloVer-containing protein [Candidatus Baltobacteraceae bacterium]|nr:choice-of-anchor tandem repeat GloVer-containing protein [Candidatus Baltobacteraceae bacterium]